MSKKDQSHSQSYATAEGKTVIPSWCQAFPGTDDKLYYGPFVWNSISEDSASHSVVNKTIPFTFVHIFIYYVYTHFPLVYAEGGRNVFLPMQKWKRHKI
jgi:hypothetical protein